MKGTRNKLQETNKLQISNSKPLDGAFVSFGAAIPQKERLEFVICILFVSWSLFLVSFLVVH
jgi:hypothetical protein